MSTQLTEILNFLPISERVSTAGQPTVEQFAGIQEAGYQIVVNLAPPGSTNWIANEKEIVESLRMKYISIPVIWEHPTLENLSQFFSVMNENESIPIFVHCAKNMRVSAFIYLYRRIEKQVDEAIAQADLYKIWTPNQTWSQFIQAALEQ
jgi:protein tyrosine phosphatase (PTP) superfamily phosphohydrolase (DUF442 family)